MNLTMSNGEEDEILINFVRNDEWLYNIKCKEYKNINKKKKTEGNGRKIKYCLSLSYNIISVCYTFKRIACMNFKYFIKIQRDVHMYKRISIAL